MKYRSVASKFSWNSPVILSCMVISGIATVLNLVTNGFMNDLLFSCYRFNILNPLGYLRMFTHIFGHDGFSHFSGNMMMLCIVGPIVEEKYGSINTAAMITIAALVTGLTVIVFMPGVAICGASGIVFMMILLCSVTNQTNGKIPITMILVAVMYLSNEIHSLLFVSDDIANSVHLIGGILGIVFGFTFRRI